MNRSSLTQVLDASFAAFFILDGVSTVLFAWSWSSATGFKHIMFGYFLLKIVINPYSRGLLCRSVVVGVRTPLFVFRVLKRACVHLWKFEARKKQSAVPFTNTVVADSDRRSPQHKSQPATASGDARTRTLIDAARLALLLCSTYSHARTNVEAPNSTPFDSYLVLANDPNVPRSRFKGDSNRTTSQRTDQLLEWILFLVLLQVTHTEAIRNPLSSAASVLSDSVVIPLDSRTVTDSPTTSPNTEMQLILHPSRHAYPSTRSLRPSLNVCIPESSVSFASLPEDALPHIIELHKVTRDRDLFQARAYQLAFKVDEFHNQQSRMLCALERAEARIAELECERSDLGVALACAVTATWAKGKRPSIPASPGDYAGLATRGFQPISGVVVVSPREETAMVPSVFAEAARSAAVEGPTNLVFYPRSTSPAAAQPEVLNHMSVEEVAVTHTETHSFKKTLGVSTPDIFEPLRLPTRKEDVLGVPKADTDTPPISRKRTETWAHSSRKGQELELTSDSREHDSDSVPRSSRAKKLLTRVVSTLLRKPPPDAAQTQQNENQGGVRAAVDLDSFRLGSAKPIFAALPKGEDSIDDKSDDERDAQGTPSPSPKCGNGSFVDDLTANGARLYIGKNNLKDLLRPSQTTEKASSVTSVKLNSKNDGNPAKPSIDDTLSRTHGLEHGARAASGSEKTAWRSGAGLRERMSNINFKNATSGSIGFGRRRQTTAPPQAMSDSTVSGMSDTTGRRAVDPDRDAEVRKRYAPYFQAPSQGQGAANRPNMPVLKRTQSLSIGEARPPVQKMFYMNGADCDIPRGRLRAMTGRGSKDVADAAESNIFTESLWNRRAQARERERVATESAKRVVSEAALAA